MSRPYLQRAVRSADWPPHGMGIDGRETSPVEGSASLVFVKHRVFDSLALSVFSCLVGDPRLSVGRDYRTRREGGLAPLLEHHLVGAGVDSRKRYRITIRAVTDHGVIVAVEFAAAFPMLRLT